ncbi:MAG: pyridoxine 5'-phosphate synthase [Planctomycetota bacterium]|nr:pyridoxine 5'-phosphate synthase [Planctomycetota bacterium]
MKLGVNVDHVATIRQARLAAEPDPVIAAAQAESGGADSIVIHLREDRRHIQDRDLRLMRQTVRTRLNLEMGTAREIVAIALEVRPDQVTLVPERRKELTTEGGLDVMAHRERVVEVVEGFDAKGIPASLFIDPIPEQIAAARQVGAKIIELHTGAYANATTPAARLAELKKLEQGARFAANLKLMVAAGHGLTYFNVTEVVAIREIGELNIGHSIIARAVLVGIDRAVREMKQLMAR